MVEIGQASSCYDACRGGLFLMALGLDWGVLGEV